jgi:PTS system fructose-specific IIC component
MKEALIKHKQYLLNGVSFAIPFIACGGILIAAAIAFAPMSDKGPDFSNSPILKHILTVGETSFKLLLPVLAGYIAYAMAGKPGLVAGFVGGAFAAMPQQVGDRTANAGFLGALLAGLVAGHIVNLIKKIPMHKYIRPVMPILIIPVLSSLAVGTLMFVVDMPIARIMVGLDHGLRTMHQGNAVLLAIVLGAMIAFDMGGPVNKTAFFFGASMIEQGNCLMMGAIAAAICTPPLGMGLATLLNRKLWTEEQQESGYAALGMGMIGITEGAIPFAASDPLRVIPCIMVGSMTAAVAAMIGQVGDHAPHGGPIVLAVVDHRMIYVAAIIIGTVVTAIAINTLKLYTQKKEGVQ